jgi:hypothetical protein
MVPEAHLFFSRFKQATLELAGREKWPAFFSAVQGREAFHGLRVQDITEFDSD